MNEQMIIQALRRHCPSNNTIVKGIGDDSAVLRPMERAPLVCSDMLMDGVHFLVNEQDPSRIGHKALAVNLSDIAAMGGRAESAYVNLALPRTLCKPEVLEPLYEGMSRLAQRFAVAIAGGDTNIWDGPLVLSVTVIGSAHPKGAILRSGAKAGDAIFVTGPLGGSLAGHHLNFIPRLHEARLLMDAFELHSMIDVSDGLGKDLRMIAEQSGVGAVLERGAIPLRSGLTNPVQAMDDGEDFELCFTLSEEEARLLEERREFAFCKRIGRIVVGEGLRWNDGRLISSLGFEHGRS